MTGSSNTWWQKDSNVCLRGCRAPSGQLVGCGVGGYTVPSFIFHTTSQFSAQCLPGKPPFSSGSTGHIIVFLTAGASPTCNSRYCSSDHMLSYRFWLKSLTYSLCPSFPLSWGTQFLYYHFAGVANKRENKSFSLPSILNQKLFLAGIGHSYVTLLFPDAYWGVESANNYFLVWQKIIACIFITFRNTRCWLKHYYHSNTIIN